MRIWKYTYSRDNLQENGHTKDLKLNKKEWKEYGESKRLTKNQLIQEWLDDHYDLDEENNNSEGYTIKVEWNVKNVLEYNENWWVESFNAGKFWILAISDKIWINQKKKDIRFFELLNRKWKLFLLNPNYKLSYKSLLKVKLSNWESETMPAWVFLKYLGEGTWAKRIDFNMDYIIKKYDINWDNNTEAKFSSDINYFGWSTRVAA